MIVSVEILLQTFTGHTAAVKSIHALESENSFLTGSRDKTAKVWALRSQGDGSDAVSCQWTYGQHRKSVFSVHFLEGHGRVASCDGNVHVWDPFVGSCVSQIDCVTPFTVVAPVDSPAPLLIGAGGDPHLRLVDCRTGGVVYSVKVVVGSSGPIRAVASLRNGHGVIVGHSSGNLTLADLRTGKLRHSWKVKVIVLSVTSIVRNTMTLTHFRVMVLVLGGIA